MGCDTGREEEACIAFSDPREEGAGYGVRRRQGGEARIADVTPREEEGRTCPVLSGVPEGGGDGGAAAPTEPEGGEGSVVSWR